MLKSAAGVYYVLWALVVDPSAGPHQDPVKKTWKVRQFDRLDTCEHAAWKISGLSRYETSLPEPLVMFGRCEEERVS